MTKPTTPQNAAQMTEALTRSLEQAKMTTETARPKLKKRPTETALRAALYALLAARDEAEPAIYMASPSIDTAKKAERLAVRIACRVMLAHMKLEQSPDNVQAAMTELVRACLMTGIAWKGVGE